MYLPAKEINWFEVVWVPPNDMLADVLCVHSPCGPNISPLGLSQLKVGCQAPAEV